MITVYSQLTGNKRQLPIYIVICMSCAGYAFCQLDTARIIWGEEPQLRKYLHHISLQTSQWSIFLYNEWLISEAQTTAGSATWAGGVWLYRRAG